MSISNGSNGVYAVSPMMTFSAILELSHSVVSQNGGGGVVADGSGPGTVIVRVGSSMVTENVGAGFNQAGGSTFASTKDNFVAGNAGGDAVGTIGSVPFH